MIDLHLHSSFSFDSGEVQENYIKKAILNGDKILGFSEHYDYDSVLRGIDLGLADCEKYRQNIQILSKKYPQIKALYGIELGYSERTVEHYQKLLNRVNFDYVILSIHALDGIGDFYGQKPFEILGVEIAYEEYLKAVLNSVKSQLDFQIIAHLGYCERYCRDKNARITDSRYFGLIDEILTEIIKRDKCLEINTSITDGEFLPDARIVKRYIELGGKNFTFGSDAHTADRYLDKSVAVKKFLKSNKIDKLCYFVNKKKYFYLV